MFDITRVCFCCLVAQFLAFSQTKTANVLLRSTSTRVPFNFSGATVGNWSGGALILVEAPRSALPVFRVFDGQGREIARFPFTLPEATLINVYSGRFARGFDGSVALAGSAYSRDLQGASFFAWIAPDGKRQTVIRTSPFATAAITVAPDGTIWAAGLENGGSKSDYPVIRRFDRTGKMIGSAILRSTLVLSDLRRFTDPTDHSYLASSSDRVGWFSEAAGTYISFALDGAEMSRITLKSLADTRVYGLAVCDDGNAFVGAQRFPPTGRQWGVLAIDASSSDGRTFVPSNGTAGPLYGCDGTKLVAQTDASSVSWLTPATNR